MAIEDYKHQAVREDVDDFDNLGSSDGEWEVVVHNCLTPSLAEINRREAAVNTVWKCGNCGHRWKLINRAKHGTIAALNNEQTLVWRRITPVDDDENLKKG